jgi:MFS family permease
MLRYAPTMAAYAALPPETPVWTFYGILALLGVFGIGWFPLYLLQIAEIAPKPAATVSAATTLCMVVMPLGPLVFGLIVDRAGYRLAWAVLILPLLLLVPLLVRLPVRAVS